MKNGADSAKRRRWRGRRRPPEPFYSDATIDRWIAEVRAMREAERRARMQGQQGAIDAVRATGTTIAGGCRLYDLTKRY